MFAAMRSHLQANVFTRNLSIDLPVGYVALSLFLVDVCLL